MKRKTTGRKKTSAKHTSEKGLACRKYGDPSEPGGKTANDLETRADAPGRFAAPEECAAEKRTGRGLAPSVTRATHGPCL